MMMWCLDVVSSAWVSRCGICKICCGVKQFSDGGHCSSKKRPQIVDAHVGFGLSFFMRYFLGNKGKPETQKAQSYPATLHTRLIRHILSFGLSAVLRIEVCFILVSWHLFLQLIISFKFLDPQLHRQVRLHCLSRTSLKISTRY